MKTVEVKSFLLKRRVTQGYLERQKMKPFGIGTSEDDIRQNVNLTSIQRENVWHPYYEVKMEEEDFKEKIQAKQKEKKEKAGNQEIDEIETKLKILEEKERQEKQDALDAAAGKKKGYDFKERLAKLKEEEKYEQSIPQEDPYTVKLRNLSNDITEEDLKVVMSRFGEIVKVKIPTEELRNGRHRSYGFAFVTFAKVDSASQALEHGEVNVEYTTLEIERALKRAAPQRESKFSEFDQLRRR